MTTDEIRIVRNRLGEYLSWKVLAEEAEKKASELEEVLLTVGSPHSPALQSFPHNQNPVSLETRYNAILTEQQEWQAIAEQYRENMGWMENFLQDNFCGQTLEVFQTHFFQGMSYEEMEYKFSLSAPGLRHIVFRALERLEFSAARMIL